MYESENIGSFQQDKQSCASINSSLLTFFDDVDLVDYIGNSFPQSYYVKVIQSKKNFHSKIYFFRFSWMQLITQRWDFSLCQVFM